MKLSFVKRTGLVLAAGLLAVSAAACGGEKTPSGGGGSAANGDVNFGGATLKVSIWSDSTIPKLGNSEAGDASYYALEQ
ncbi:MAG: hypothetical protein KHX46_01495, partial [Clostridiales bacterium]|nr:hypothetical protein [Clostridiales bacterium]